MVKKIEDKPENLRPLDWTIQNVVVSTGTVKLHTQLNNVSAYESLMNLPEIEAIKQIIKN